MTNQFLCKARYTKQLENGTFKRVTEPFLLNAVSFTEAEKSVYHHLGMNVQGEFTVTSIARAEYQDIILNDTTGVYFESIIETTNEDGKKAKQKVLFEAGSVKGATELVQDWMGSSMVDFKILSTKETPIKDVFDFMPTDSEENYSMTTEEDLLP